MRNSIRFLMIMAFSIVAVIAVYGGVHPAALLAMPPIVLDTQTIVFLTSLKEEYNAIDTWLSEAEDLSTFVKDGQTLIFPESGAYPAVYKNRTTDVDSVEPTETTNEVALDVYDSQNVKIRNINLHALPFDKVAHYTKKAANAIIMAEVADAAHTFAPDVAGTKKIIIPSTGATRSGYKSLTLSDIVTLAMACDNAEFPSDGRNLVLPSDMWWDLVNNNDVLKAQLSFQLNTGVIDPKIVNYYGFKIHKSIQKLNVGWNLATSAKAAQGTVITGDIVPAGFVFVKTEVFRAGGLFEMFRVVKNQNVAGRAEEFGFQHRFKGDFQMSGKRYSALVYLAKSV